MGCGKVFGVSCSLLSFLFFFVSSSAQESPPAPQLDELVTQVLQNAPQLDALKSRYEAARQRIAPARSLPDPMIEMMWQDVSFPEFTVGQEEMSMVTLEVRQGFPFLRKLRALASSAEADSQMKAAELFLLQRTLVLQVRTLYARIYALDSEKRLLESSRDLLDLLSATAQVRYSTGESNQSALIKAQLEVFRIEERFDDLLTERLTSSAELSRWTGSEGVLGEVRELPEIESLPESWEALALKNAPELEVARSLLQRGEREVDVAKSELLPSLSAGTGLGVREELDPVVTLRVGLEYPLWQAKEKRMLVRAEELEVEALRLDWVDREAWIRAEVSRLSAQWERDKRQIRRYREAILPETSAAMDAARSSYLVGQGDFSAVVEDFRMWLEARTGLAQREADRFRTWSEIQAMIQPAEEVAP